MKQQKHKLIKRVLSVVLSLSMALCLIPSTVFAAEGDVAKIGDTTYTTLDDAVAAAANGATIELLGDATTNGLNLSKDLTIQGAEGLKPTVTFDNEGIHATNSKITFRDCIVRMTVSENPSKSGGTANLIDDSDLIFVNADVSIVNNHADPGGESAIYLYQGSNLYIQDKSHMTVSGFNDTSSDSGIYADGSERDDNLPHFQISVTNNSSLTITDCGWGGMTINPCDLTVSGQSKLTISDCGGNGGKQGLGCYYGKMTIEDSSTVNVSNNNGSDWGIFIKDLEVDGTSTLIANNNAGTSDGIDIGGTAIIQSGATIETSNNADAGIRVYKSGTWSGDVTIQSGATVNTSKNGAAGISNNNILTIEKGANVNIVENVVSGIRNNSGATATLNGNVNIQRNQYSGVYNNGGTIIMTSGTILYNSTTGYGGGIHNGGTANISNGVSIYNNHANTAGDDIYNRDGSTITFSEVGSGWALDGEPDCEHLIDGWYDDSTNTRWEAHAETEEGNHIIEFTTFEDGLATVSSLTALKAAHGTDAKDKTSLPGLDKDIVTDNGDVKEDTVAAGDTVTFKLESNVPENLKDYITYPVDDPAISTLAIGTAGTYALVFHDEMAEELALNEDSFEIKLSDEIIDPQYYTITTTGLGDGCTFEIFIDLATLYNNSIITENDLGVTPITVTYTAVLNTNTTAGDYHNTAWVTYPDDGKSREVVVTVETFKIEIFKYDQVGRIGLAGAVFE